MPFCKPSWKENWEQTRQHYVQWWNREGPVFTIIGPPPLREPRENVAAPTEEKDARKRNTNPEWFAQDQRARMASRPFPADNLPIAFADYGCVPLAAYLGAEPHFTEETVWYTKCIEDPDALFSLKLTKREHWWQVYKSVLLELVRVSNGDFLVGAPAFGSIMDALAALRGAEDLLCDMMERPAWVMDRLEEITEAFFTAFDDYYQHIRLSDGSSAHTYFHLWGPGKTSQVQCDFSALISPAMFKEFVLPHLRRQCAWLDHSLFHLDGPSCICHLDHVLSIKDLDAVQWTPGTGHAGVGDPKWFDLYDRVLKGGKALQLLDLSLDEAQRIVDAFGSRGLYFGIQVTSERDVQRVIEWRQAT